jgi:prevent-host-death family protein
MKEAKNSLSRLVLAARRGDRVFLTYRGEPVIELVAIQKPAGAKPSRGLGMYKDVRLPTDFGSTKQRREATTRVLKMMGLPK